MTDPPAEALALVERVLQDPDAGTQDLIGALTALRELREELASWEHRLIAAARTGGASWASIAPALGVTSRQAAERRYLRLRPSEGHPTGEARVRAERDRRAGDRAVRAWARRNSGTLRRLAGRVGALQGLGGQARRHAERVGRALADDDPANLLSPLAEAHAHLPAHHAGLAQEIRAVTEYTERLRRDTHEARRA
jgi:hypothetical protein